MKKSLVLVLLTALYAVADPDARLDDLDTELEDGVEVSPECAVVIVTGGVVVGGFAAAAMITLLELFLNAIGFAAIGVEGGSSAASWQSTFPLVEAGSMFSKLQSISMSEEVGSELIPLGAIVGGAVAAGKMRDLCHRIDGIDSESLEAEVISALKRANQEVKEDAQKLEENMIKKYHEAANKVGQWGYQVNEKARNYKAKHAWSQWVEEKTEGAVKIVGHGVTENTHKGGESIKHWKDEVVDWLN